MVSGSDAQSSGEIIEDCKESGFELQWHPESLDAAVQRNADNEGNVEPVDVFVPVRPGHRCLCDMWLLRIIFGVSIRLRGLRHRCRL